MPHCLVTDSGNNCVFSSSWFKSGEAGTGHTICYVYHSLAVANSTSNVQLLLILSLKSGLSLEIKKTNIMLLF